LLPPAVLAADLDMDLLYSLNAGRFESAPVPAYPPVIEDLAVVGEHAQHEDQSIRNGGFC
jgi:hypothetical protein